MVILVWFINLRSNEMNVLTSRRFWAAIAALAVDIASYMAANYVSDPKLVGLLGIIMAAAPLVAGILINSYTKEDVAAMEVTQKTLHQLKAENKK